MTIRPSLILLSAILFSAGCAGEVADPNLDEIDEKAQPFRTFAPRGAVTVKWGEPDVNRCVPDVAQAIQDLRDTGDVFGFYLNGFTSDLHLVPKNPRHWQGIQRVPFGTGRGVILARGGTPMFASALMESRAGDGRRFRSNRLVPTIQKASDTPPDGKDRLVAEVLQDANFNHTGGTQALGRYAALPLENGIHPSRIVMYDVADPAVPQRLSTFIRDPAHKEAGAVGFTKLGDGTYLMAIAHADANEIAWYASNTLTGWSEGRRIAVTGAESYRDRDPGYVHEHGSYQSVNLVTQCDGSLFLLGTYNTAKSTLGGDYVDAWQIGITGTHPGASIRLSWAGRRHLYCTHEEERQCNLAAAGGTYVDPDGQLIVYSTEHRADGPGARANVKMMEFRSRDPNPRCDVEPNRMWVELYDDSDFSDRSLMLDWVDRGALNYADFDYAQHFEDKASAVRWCLPPGRRLRLYEDKGFSGSSIDLVGRGHRRLHGFGDNASSARWLQD